MGQKSGNEVKVRGRWGHGRGGEVRVRKDRVKM